MTWPQFYVLAAMIIAFAIGLGTEARNPKRTRTFLVVYVSLRICLDAVMALVLHAGGFW